MRRLTVVFLLVFLAACGGSDDPAAGPADVAESLMRAYDAGDCDKVKELSVTPDDIDCSLVEATAGTFSEDGIDLDEATYTATDIVDDSASVTIDWNNDSPTETIDLQRVDGVWKVIHDTAA